MIPQSELTVYAGLDWASDHHDLIVVDRRGQRLESLRFDHTLSAWQQTLARLRELGVQAVAIETTRGMAVQQLLDAGVTVYPVMPRAAAHYRTRKAPAGVKDDQLDAWSLADALRTDGHAWQPLPPDDPLVTELRLLCSDEITLIEQRTALINQLRAALGEYYPAALEAFEDWTGRGPWHFVLAFPTPQALVKAGKKKWEKFLHTHKLWRPQTKDERLEIFARAGGFCGSAAVTAAKSQLAGTLARLLLTLEIQIEAYRKKIGELFAGHPQSGLFGSLPGAGDKLAPRLLSCVLHRIAAGVSAAGLQSLAGTAPVTFQSGQIHRCHIRRHCDRELRATVHLWADGSRKKCTWAQTYYQAHRDKGQSHACALRCLAQRWLKILHAMIASGKPYDEGLHLKNMTAHGSWNLKLNPA